MKEESKYKYQVCVKCYTFNQAKYITDAMDGFAMQQTESPYVCCIVDDASTDAESEVIVGYLKDHFEDYESSRKETENFVSFFARHKTNENCYFAAVLLKHNHYQLRKTKLPYISEWMDHAEFQAICEGDDYWIDSEKLQKQTVILRNNEQYQMCTHNYYTVVADTKENMGSAQIMDNDGLLSMETILFNRHIPQTATFFYRTGALDNQPEFFKKLTDVGDYQIRVLCAMRGGVYYITKPMSCYRSFSTNSWTSSMSKASAKYIGHVNQMIEFAKDFDEYTEGQYKDIANKRIDYCVYLRCVNEGNFKAASKTKFFSEKSLKEKTKLYIEHCHPKLWRFIAHNYIKITGVR